MAGWPGFFAGRLPVCSGVVAVAVIRLDKMLSVQGVCTRKEVRELLRGGGITINGKQALKPEDRVNTDTDRVSVCGTEIVFKRHIYIMLNKPSGVISASEDPRAKTVIDLLPENLKRPGLFPVGRLDKDTEGLLVVTDDGQFAHEVLAPKKHVDKTYHALIDSPTTPLQRQAFENRLVIDGGYTCLPAKISVLDVLSGTLLQVTISEGKYHQIKRMFHALGKEVLALKRVAMGGLKLDESLKPGEARELREEEVSKLFQ